MQNQLEAINKKEIIIASIFPPDEVLKQFQLSKIFKNKKIAQPANCFFVVVVVVVVVAFCFFTIND